MKRRSRTCERACWRTFSARWLRKKMVSLSSANLGVRGKGLNADSVEEVEELKHATRWLNGDEDDATKRDG